MTFTVGDGLKLVLQPSSAVGLVSMAFVVAGGVLPETPETSVNGATPASSDEDLIQGPQLPGEANSQDDIDALLANFD